VRTVHVVVPDTVDDPSRPSGGNTYDRRVCAGLTALGWSVHLHPVPGRWPRPEAKALAVLAEVLTSLPDGSLALLDGLVASCTPGHVVPETARLRVVVLVHMPLGEPPDGDGPGGGRADEAAVLTHAAAVLTTSDWTRRHLLDCYPLDPARLHVAEPGVDRADLAPGTTAGGQLLCVAAVIPGKGHDQLAAALAQVADLPWRCTCAGAVDLDPTFFQRVVHQSEEQGIADRLRFAGPLADNDLNSLYAGSDVLLLASRKETYAMVVTEALARGLPVLAWSVGGVPEALGEAPDGMRPGLLVPAGDVEALAAAARAWLSDQALRRRLRRAAEERRLTLPPWSVTARRVADVLEETGARP
jgi:glycosyltransferase involved in cell wall biosynthesis